MNPCIKGAARRVKNEALYTNPDGSEETKLVLSSASRALWFNNLGLARKLIDYSASAKDHICTGDSQVKAFSFQAFETIFGLLQHVPQLSAATDPAADDQCYVGDAEEAIEIYVAMCKEDAFDFLEDRRAA